MDSLLFELTNEQRRYLGLCPVEKDWDLIKLNNLFLYFDGDIIRKKIVVSDNGYFEQELCEKTAENRSILLPKTTKGKPQKMNFTATQSFRPFGIYFNFSADYVCIANYATQTTYFKENFKDEKSLEYLKYWLNQWVADTTETDLSEIEMLKNAKRRHCKFKEGDFFAYKIGRRKWGFGRILIDVGKLRKSEDFKRKKNYGLANLMGKALIVKVYHKISDTLNINLDELAGCMALPSQAIMDNHFYYGEYVIIGNKKLEICEYEEPLISYSRSINSTKEPKSVYLQYGLIYKETTVNKFDKYLTGEPKSYGPEENPYRNESIGFGLYTENLEQCIAENSNSPFWQGEYYMLKNDLRNPLNIKVKREIFDFFELDADKSYVENLNKR